MIRKKTRDEILSYLEDASNFANGNAEEVILPAKEEEVIEVMKEYSTKSKPLTLSGAGTGNVAGRIPLCGGILATDNLNKILYVDKKNRTAVLQPGVTVQSFLNEIENNGLFYPAYPTEKLSFIGGNVSTNASGEYSLRYGSVRNYVRRMNIVLSTGEVLKIARGKVYATKDGFISFDGYKFKIPTYITPNIKSSAGYFSRPGMDLIDLFIGSEGTLGAITEIELKVDNKLPPTFSLVAFFDKETDLFSFFADVKENMHRNNKFINPLCLEYLDKNALALLRNDYPNIPSGSCGAIFLEQEFLAKEELVLKIWQELCEKYNSIDTWFAESSPSKEKFVEFRHKLVENINTYIKKNDMVKISIDIAVTERHFNELLTFYKKILSENELLYALFGHIGENHLHLNLFPKNVTEQKSAENIYTACVKKALQLSGTVSAEHGIGKLKHKYLEMMYGREGINEMICIKKIFDPKRILSQDNIFPKEYLFLP